MQIFTTQKTPIKDGGMCPAFSFYKAPIDKSVNRKTDKIIWLEDIHAMITSGVYKEITATLRNEIMIAKTNAEQQEYKRKSFDFFTPHGVFKFKNKQGLDKPSWLACIDIDHIDNPEEVKRHLVADKTLGIVLAFVSPRGQGLKALVAFAPVSANPLTAYAAVYEGLQNYLAAKYKLKPDQSASCLHQACYLSHDPSAYCINNREEIQLFEPDAWLTPIVTPHLTCGRTPDVEALELLIRALQNSHTDITKDYSDWVSIGYALVNDLAEAGLQYFLSISTLYPHYNEGEARKKYTSLMRSRHDGTNKVHLGTIFYLAKQAGIEIPFPQKTHTAEMRKCGNAEQKHKDNANSSSVLEFAPDIFGRMPDNIYPNVSKKLPILIQSVISKIGEADNVKKDIALLSILTALSSVLPNVYGTYGRERYTPHFFMSIIGPAANNKAVMKIGRYLVSPINQMLLEESARDKTRYEQEMRKYEAHHDSEIDPPQPPKEERILVGANCSAAKFRYILSKNPNGVLLFETEGSTLATTFSKDYGAYSDALRNLFGHDPISSHLRSEDYTIERPSGACLISGTPEQIKTLIPDTENGLFSRFLYWTVPASFEWETQRPIDVKDNLNQSVVRIGEKKLKPIYTQLRQHLTYFTLSSEQWDRHDSLFSPMLKRCDSPELQSFAASIKRLGLIMFRLAMVLTVIRYTDRENIEVPGTVIPFPENSLLICTDDDYFIAETIVKASLAHALTVYSHLPHVMKSFSAKRNVNFEESLPVNKEFTTPEWMDIAEKLNIHVRTAERYIGALVKAGRIERLKNGVFLKPS